MKAAIFEATGELSVQDKPVPTLNSGDILIKVELCGICASDLAALNGDITDYSARRDGTWHRLLAARRDGT